LAPLFEQRQAELDQLKALAEANDEKLKALAAAAAKPAEGAAPPGVSRTEAPHATHAAPPPRGK